MAKLECPLCGRPATTVAGKLFSDQLHAFSCRSCSRRLRLAPREIATSALLVAAPAALWVSGVSRPAWLAAAAAAFAVAVMLRLAWVPLVPAGSGASPARS